MRKQQQDRLIITLFMALLFSMPLTAQNTQEFWTNFQPFKHVKRDKNVMRSIACDQAIYRSMDGTCNNTTQPQRGDWGASDVTLKREMTAEYGDPDPYNDMNGQNRPSPRMISNLLMAQPQTIGSAAGLSSFVFTWGQFIDHDIDLTPVGQTEYYPIILPEDEPLLSIDIPFFRSAVYEGTGETNDRQQNNLITSWIDASNVYGSEVERATWLRTFQRGKLKMSAGDLLPFNTLDGEYDSAIDETAPSMAGGDGTNKTFVAGDVRAAEQPGLTCLHTLFVREHNRICDQLYKKGLRDEEEIYQAARKQVSGILQAITYQEFLPALGIELDDYSGYQPEIQPNISNIFATAAYRLGHTMVTEELLLVDNKCEAVDGGTISLLEGFFNPEVVRTYNIEPILRGLSIQTQEEVDLHITDNLRNMLFGDPTAPETFGLDLASLNIQRGRDHGLPDYNKIRGYYTGVPAEDFDQINPNPEIWTALKTAYHGDINNIDAWVGLLAEPTLPERSVGKTLHAILKKQFQNLRDGDFYYFEHDPFLSPPNRNKIRHTQLSEVISRNTSLRKLPKNIFFAEECDGPGNNGGNNGGHGNGVGRSHNGNLMEDVTTDFESTISQVQLVPNPTQGQFAFSFQSLEVTSIQLRILNTNGQVIMEENVGATDFYQQQIDLSDLPKGLYVVQVQTEKDRFVERLMVQ